jgi:hypothetical protein
MALSKDDLGAQLVEFRKASRLIMWYYDCAEKLWELISRSLESMKQFQTVDTEDLEVDEDWDKPENVSYEAFESITNASNSWEIIGCSEEDHKAKMNSFFISIGLYLDYWPKNSPKESSSGLLISGFHVNHINGRATDTYEKLEDSFDEEMIHEDDGIDSDGEILKPMELKVFPNLWSANNEKYKGDYVVGFYDLADLVDEDAVLSILIADIKKLVDEWSKV